MDWMDRIALFDPLDFAAVGIMVVGFWALIGWRVEHSSSKADQSVCRRSWQATGREWMRQMITRETRAFSMPKPVSTLRQGTSFLASTCVIAIGGAPLALMGNAERLARCGADDLTQLIRNLHGGVGNQTADW